MSPSIWTRSGASSRPPLRRLALEPHRVVESQHKVATRKLVDTDAEQAVLEALIDTAKPPAPGGMGRLHYLLQTPFRHPPLAWGSRFGTRAERGLWYGALALPTAFAEVAYYRYVFLAGTAAKLTPLAVELSAFRAAIATRKGVDLGRAPFAAFASRLASKTSYAHTQPLGRDMRVAGVEAFLFPSARDAAGGANVALFEPCFSRPSPFDLKTYLCTTTDSAVEVSRKDVTARKPERYAYPRAQFLVGGALPLVSS